MTIKTTQKKTTAGLAVTFVEISGLDETLLDDLVGDDGGDDRAKLIVIFKVKKRDYRDIVTPLVRLQCPPAMLSLSLSLSCFSSYSL